MKKLIAILCVVSWSGFWAFGYLALTAAPAEDAQLIVAALLAAAGLFTGLFTWLRLVRVTGPGHWRHVRQAEGA
ncbi:hypothetical protein [Neotabrizicola sp. VNH66]|uniref:hypothetical protein n=1 Tax=Neotabrizicola sp. VNH66 TaxID=3400918 RepID=UPI003C0F2584